MEEMIENIVRKGKNSGYQVVFSFSCNVFKEHFYWGGHSNTGLFCKG